MSDSAVQCPRCHSAEISQSRRRYFGDFFMRIVGMKPFRCMECRKRFYLGSAVERQVRQRHRWKRSSRSSVVQAPLNVAKPEATD